MRTLFFLVYFQLVITISYSQNFCSVESNIIKHKISKTSGSCTIDENFYCIRTNLDISDKLYGRFSNEFSSKFPGYYFTSKHDAKFSLLNGENEFPELAHDQDKKELAKFKNISPLIHSSEYQINKGGILSKTIIISMPLIFASIPARDNSLQDELMKKIRKRTYISGALFIPTIATGYLMSHNDGYPNTLLLTTHKLASVSNLILLDVTTIHKKKRMNLSVAEKIAAITMNVSFISTIGTGGMLSMKKPMPEAVHKMHSISPWLSVVSSGILLFLLNHNF